MSKNTYKNLAGGLDNKKHRHSVIERYFAYVFALYGNLIVLGRKTCERGQNLRNKAYFGKLIHINLNKESLC